MTELHWRDDATRYFLDTEFSERGPYALIDLISIGLVCADGREYYAVNEDHDPKTVNPWVRENVLPHLPVKGPLWRSRKAIKEDLLGFFSVSQRPEMWAYYSAYDFVLFCQLFGTMIDLPDHLPKFCMDLKQLSVEVGSPRHPKQTGLQHDALEDARYNKELFEFLRKCNG